MRNRHAKRWFQCLMREFPKQTYQEYLKSINPLFPGMSKKLVRKGKLPTRITLNESFCCLRFLWDTSTRQQGSNGELESKTQGNMKGNNSVQSVEKTGMKRQQRGQHKRQHSASIWFNYSRHSSVNYLSIHATLFY